jgi:hypothetical protein
MSDSLLIGKRRAAQRIAALALKDCPVGADDGTVLVCMKGALAKLWRSASGHQRTTIRTKRKGKKGIRATPIAQSYRLAKGRAQVDMGEMFQRPSIGEEGPADDDATPTEHERKPEQERRAAAAKKIQMRARSRKAGKTRKKRNRLKDKAKRSEAKFLKAKSVWKEAVTAGGRKYFWHVETKESRWELPEEAQMPVQQLQFAAAIMVQSMFRRALIRSKIHSEMNAAGFLMAMPGTPQGKTGWYQAEDSDVILYYLVDRNGNWSEDRKKGPMKLMDWYRSDFSNNG